MSAEWTPTTDQVRKPFFLAGNADAFDRWLAGEIREAKAEAFERGVHQGADDNELGIETYTNPYEATS